MEGTLFKIPRFIGKLFSRWAYRPAIKGGKLYATDGKAMVVFGGFEDVPEGLISEAAVKYATSRNAEVWAEGKKLSCKTFRGEIIEFPRPKDTIPDFEKALRQLEQVKKSPRLRFSMNPEILLSALQASRRELKAHDNTVNLEIPLALLLQRNASMPVVVNFRHSNAEEILFMPCRLEHEEVEANREALALADLKAIEQEEPKEEGKQE